MDTSYLFLADGFEEIEALATVDLLRRAGIEVKTVSINSTIAVRGAHGIEVAADITLDACGDKARIYIVPGGMPGSANLAADRRVCELLASQHSRGGMIAAICAAPALVLAPLGIVEGKDATCYPGMEEGLIAGGANYKKQRVVRDGHIITGNGPSSAIPFALTIIEALEGQDKADEVAGGLLV